MQLPLPAPASAGSGSPGELWAAFTCRDQIPARIPPSASISVWKTSGAGQPATCKCMHGSVRWECATTTPNHHHDALRFRCLIPLALAHPFLPALPWLCPSAAVNPKAPSFSAVRPRPHRKSIAAHIGVYMGIPGNYILHPEVTPRTPATEHRLRRQPLAPRPALSWGPACSRVFIGRGSTQTLQLPSNNRHVGLGGVRKQRRGRRDPSSAAQVR